MMPSKLSHAVRARCVCRKPLTWQSTFCRHSGGATAGDGLASGPWDSHNAANTENGARWTCVAAGSSTQAQVVPRAKLANPDYDPGMVRETLASRVASSQLLATLHCSVLSSPGILPYLITSVAHPATVEYGSMLTAWSGCAGTTLAGSAIALHSRQPALKWLHTNGSMVQLCYRWIQWIQHTTVK